VMRQKIEKKCADERHRLLLLDRRGELARLSRSGAALYGNMTPKLDRLIHDDRMKMKVYLATIKGCLGGILQDFGVIPVNAQGQSFDQNQRAIHGFIDFCADPVGYLNGRRPHPGATARATADCAANAKVITEPAQATDDADDQGPRKLTHPGLTITAKLPRP